MSHAQGAPGIKNAVRAGVRSIEHGIYLDDEAIDLMLKHGTYLVPTLQAPQAVIKAAEAAAQGSHVLSHAQGAPGIKNAVRAGVRSIEHGIYLDDEAIDLMLKHGTYLVPTLQAPQAVIKAAEAGESLPASVVDKAHRV